MEFDLNEDERELRDAARRFLEREAPVAYARAMMDDERGYGDRVWKQMADLGWMGLPIPEQYGGLGMGPIALMVLLVEMGRVVLPGPYLSTMLAGLAIARYGSESQQRHLLPRIAAGDLIATFAHEGRVDADGDILRGGRRFVLDGHIAEAVLVVAHTGERSASVFLAEPRERRAIQTIDQTRRLADLSFDGVRAERLGSSEHDAVIRVLDLGSMLLSAEMLGAAERVTEFSVEYAKQRVQFGRPIGSFQAVKHRLADMLVDVESMRNAVYYAAWALERDNEEAALAASMAKAFTSEASVRVAKSGLQVHGGIGFTWEHDMHLYLKRVTLDAAAFGSATLHRERIAQMLRERAASTTPAT